VFDTVPMWHLEIWFYSHLQGIILKELYSGPYGYYAAPVVCCLACGNLPQLK
jgi:hypothetical protein